FYELLCKIKDIFDPAGLMNPGKIINDDADIMVKNLRAGLKFLPERLETDLLFEKNELLLALDQCNGCGVCRSRESDLRICPVFRAVGEEMGNSRAKANILNSWATGQLKEEDFESPEFRKFLDLCINCKACLVQCADNCSTSRICQAQRIAACRACPKSQSLS
ncbi:MAG: 4Fe-4S dicluster domain-containing protein, partial [Planctomycetota bacterium]